MEKTFKTVKINNLAKKMKQIVSSSNTSNGKIHTKFMKILIKCFPILMLNKLYKF